MCACSTLLNESVVLLTSLMGADAFPIHPYSVTGVSSDIYTL